LIRFNFIFYILLYRFDYAKEVQPDNFMGFLKASCQSGHYSSAELEKKAKEEELAKRKEEEQRKRRMLKRWL